ncbi:RNA-directed DNA polymerase from mobile element jockey, partial [Nephila pilipes]
SNKKFLTVSSVYRPPLNNNFTADIEKIFRNRPHSILVGDFNCKHHSWSPISTDNNPGKTLFRHSLIHGYKIHAPSDPTHIPYSSRYHCTIIDIGLSQGICDPEVTTSPVLSSDHNPVTFKLKLENFSNPLNTYLFTNWNKFQNYLSDSITGNPPINNIEEVDTAIENFNSCISTAINQASICKVLNKPHSNLPLSIRRVIKEKNNIRKIWQDTRDPNYKTLLNRMRKKINKLIRIHNKNTTDNFLETARAEDSTLHDLVKSTKKTVQIIPPLLGHRGLVYSTLDKANLFVDSLEESFTENPDVYSDDHIEKIERTVNRYINRNDNTSPPNLTSP